MGHNDLYRFGFLFSDWLYDRMGNRVVVGLGEANKVIRVITSNGGVMEFSTPITSGSITGEFPGHAIFPSNANDILGKPLLHHEQLLPAKSYYLLPLNTKDTTSGNRRPRQVHHVRSNSVPASLVVPYRMTQPTLKRSHTDVFSRYKYNHHHPGVLKVKLVITTEHLLEILSQEARTQELIEGVRTVAKFGNGSHQHLLASEINGVRKWVGMLPQIKLVVRHLELPTSLLYYVNK